MFEKIEKAGVVLPVELKNEIGSYFNQIKDEDIIAGMQDAIIIILNKHKGIEGELLRTTCLSAMFKQIGLDVMHSRAKLCSKKFCDYAIDLFVGKDCRIYEIEDRKVFYRIDEINDDILAGMKRYYIGEFYDGDAFNSIINKGSMTILQNRLDGIANLYPDIARDEIVEYILHYTRTRAYLKPNEDTMVDSVKRATELGANFFIYTDKLLVSDDNDRLANLEKYINRLESLNFSGYKTKDLFVRGTLGLEEVNTVIKAIELEIMVSIDEFAESPNQALEYYRWKIKKLPISKYMELGYKKISQLKIIRMLLQKRIDPFKFKIDSTMSGAEMLAVINEKLSFYNPTLTLMTL